MWMRASIAIGFTLLSISTVSARLSEPQIVQQSSVVLEQIMSAPAQSIPRQLLTDAQAVVIVPQLKGGAFVVGIRKGHGVVVVREANGGWRAPQFVEMTGGSVGWQAGVQSSDVILVFRSRESLDNLMSGKLTIGADASVAAGPVGRQVAAATDLDLSAEIYSYSRSRGAFVGVAIDGTVLKSDPHADSRYYPPGGAIPQDAGRLVGQLSAYVGGGTTVAETSLVLPATPVAAMDSGQHQLIEASRRLSALLDPQWQQYLALPEAVYQSKPLDGQTLAGLEQSLMRYEAVAADPRFASLTTRPEFQLVLATTRHLVSQPQQGQLTLPPPPATTQSTRPRFPR